MLPFSGSDSAVGRKTNSRMGIETVMYVRSFMGNLQSDFQKNRTDSMDYFSSKTSRSDEARFRKSMGFSMYLLTPRASAFFADILSL